MKNLLIIGLSQTGKTTLAHSFAHHFLAKRFEEDRIDLKPRSGLKGETNQTSMYVIEGETQSLCLLDTVGPRNIISGNIGEDMEQIIDNIIETLIGVNMLHGVILVTNAITRRDPIFHNYLSRLLPILPDNVRANFYVICTRNVGDVEQEVKENVSEMLEFKLDDKKWFTMDNKCMKPYKSFKEDDYEIFEEYWTIGRQTFWSIYEMMKSSTPLSTSCLQDSPSNKMNAKKLIQELGSHREKLFVKVRERAKASLILPTMISAPPANQPSPDKNKQTCKYCKPKNSSKNILKSLTRFGCCSSQAPYSKCKCHLNLNSVKLPEYELKFPNRSLISSDEEPLNIQSSVDFYLGDPLREMIQVFSTLRCSDYMHDLYKDDLENVTKNFMDLEPVKNVRVLLIQAVDAEKKLYMRLKQ